jgi:tetratricopeptide (TPR) repeat protein
LATKNELEQEALRQTKRGNYSKAARIYHAILRQQPRDRRIRQKLGEIYLKMGQKKEGAKYMREVAGLAQREGQHRVAIAIYRQLSQLLEDDLEIIGALADCYRENNQVHEATAVYERALNLAKGTRSWPKAVEYATALSAMKPSDMALQFTLAELKESAGDIEEALVDYRRMAASFTRRGEMGEVARVAESALRLGEGDPDPEFLALSIRARVATGDFDRALENAKPIIDALDEQLPAVVEALGIALQKRGEESKARRLLLDVAVRYRDVGDSEGQARALGLALEAGTDDPKLRKAMAHAKARAEKLKRTLADESVLAPASDEELIICTKAETQARYGFPERAEATLKGGTKQLPRSYSISARRVEILLVLGHKDDALNLLERLVRAASGSAREAMASRLLILGGPDLLAVGGDADAEVESEELMDAGDAEPEPSEDEELIDDDDDELLEDDDEELLTDEELETGSQDEEAWSSSDDDEELLDDDAPGGDGPLAKAEALAAQGDLDGAIVAFQEAFREDPLNDEILMRIAEVRREQRQAREEPAAPTPPEPDNDELEAASDDADDDLGDLGFGSPSVGQDGSSGGPPMSGIGASSSAGGGAAPGRWKDLLGGGKKPSTPEPDSEPEPDFVEVDTVDTQTTWALLAVERYQQALDQARGFTGLMGRWLEARALAGLGEHSQALTVLRDALEEADEDDNIYPEALYLLALLQLRQGRVRAALRVARELKADFPEFRSDEVTAMVRGLTLLR